MFDKLDRFHATRTIRTGKNLCENRRFKVNRRFLLFFENKSVLNLKTRSEIVMSTKYLI